MLMMANIYNATQLDDRVLMTLDARGNGFSSANGESTFDRLVQKHSYALFIQFIISERSFARSLALTELP